MINVISQSTAERRAETVALFKACKPYLDKGMSLGKSVRQVSDKNITNVKNGWYRDLINYAISQGYDYNKRKWSRGKP